VRLSRPDRPAIVLGRSSDPRQEVHLDRAVELDLPLLRRRGGGCTVLLDPGNLVVSIARPLEGFGGIHRHFRWISDWLATELAACGVGGVTREGISDLVLEGRKIGGSCIYRARGLIYYSTTLLVEPDVDLMEGCLAHPPREPEYRAGRRHRDFILALGERFPELDTASLAASLERRLTAERWLSHPEPLD